MVAIRDAVVTSPQLSASMLRRNTQMHDSPTKTIPAGSFQHQVYCARKKLCAHQLIGFNLVTDTESYRAYIFVTELEIHTVRVLSRPYNQGPLRWHGTEATDRVTGAVQQYRFEQRSFRQSAHILGRLGRMIASVDTRHQQEI
jgi:hypothetical protein